VGAGLANRPNNSLPGMGEAGLGSRLPNQGAGIQDRRAERPQTMEDRRTDLNSRLSEAQGGRQENRGDRQDDRQEWRDGSREDRQDFRNENREDWQDFAQEYHGDWYNGSWDPGEGWDYMWDNYPGAAAIGVTRWGVNRLAYGFGYWGYSNPWGDYGYSSGSSYSYAEPMVTYVDSSSSSVTVESGAEQTDVAAAALPQPTDEGMQAFDEARTAFYGGEFEKALTLLDTTLKTMPSDPVVHEFRGLVFFSLKKYSEASAAVYAVLSAGPGWDWTTMSGLYSNVEVYTQQLRELENFVKATPTSADGNFLLGYHYLSMGHKDAAAEHFAAALQQLPGDKLLIQLAGEKASSGQKPTTPPAPPAPADLAPEKVLTVDKLVGNWAASSAGAQFELTLTAEGAFTWSFSRGDKKESVKGVFAVDQNALAMEPDAGGTMLAEIDLTSPTAFTFKMVGGGADDPGLQFAKE
jgi:tetratricopeptide (TPR) repeat protein